MWKENEIGKSWLTVLHTLPAVVDIRNTKPLFVYQHAVARCWYYGPPFLCCYGDRVDYTKK